MLATLCSVRAAGYQVQIAAPPAGRLPQTLQRQGVTTLAFDSCDTLGRRLPSDQIRTRLKKLVDRQAPDLVHANSLSMGRISGPILAELGVPSLAHLRDIIRLSRAAIDDLNCHGRLLAVSHATRDYHVQAGLAPEKIKVLYNGVDLHEFAPRPASGYLHGELGLTRGMPPRQDCALVGSIGQISIRKGLDVMLKAAKHVASRSKDVHFVVIGDRHSQKSESRQLERDLHTAAGSDPLSGRVHFLGYRTDVARILNELTLLVHPARQEPAGRVLMEAAASGVAILATDVGGTREILPPDAVAARLVPPDDMERLAKAMSELLDQPHTRYRLATAARRRMEVAFDSHRAAKALLEHYRACQMTKPNDE